jgi:phytoene dehydrogenase-like protein
MARPFKALKGNPRSTYDAVVIGGGIGGLIGANLLARERLRVLLVEQHYMLGGYCSTFRRGGSTFDAATHFYPLLGNPATLTGGLLAELGIHTRWVRMDPVDHFHFPDGSSFSVPADFEQYLPKLKAQFPHERDAIDRFFALVREAYMFGLLHYFRGRDHERFQALKHLTVRDVLDQHFQDDKLKLLLAGDCGHWGAPPKRTSFVFDSMLRLSYFLGNYYPEGGSQAFADELGRRFEELGGEILMRGLVTRILVEEGAASGVEIELGSGNNRRLVRVRATTVVSNADLVLTLEKLLGPEYADPALLGSIKAMRATHPCFLVHIGLKNMPVEVLRGAEGYHWDQWNPDNVATSAFKIFVPTLFEPRLAPPGGQIIILQKLTAIEYEQIEDWAAHKDSVHQYLMRRLDAAIPGFADKVVVMSSASALTSYRYTLNYRGAMLGWEMSPDQLGADRPNIDGPVRNLYLVGHWTQPGGGITPVIISAIQTARRITRNTGSVRALDTRRALSAGTP